MIPCEICVILYPDKYKDHPETCPVCHGAKEHFQPAQMMTKEMADAKAREIDAAIERVDDGAYEELRALEMQKLIHALVYDESQADAIAAEIRELDKILGSPLGEE